MFPIIGLAGPARSGKSTLAEWLMEDINFDAAGPYRMYGLSWPLKRAVNEIFGWDERHAEGELKEVVDQRLGISPRMAYQRIGTEFGRDGLNTLFPELRLARGDVWIARADRELEHSPLIVVDVRFPNEVAWLDRNGGLLVHVQRSGGAGIQCSGHSSEQELPRRAGDFIVAPCANLEELSVEADRLADFVRAHR